MVFELDQARESYKFALQQIRSWDRKLESYLKVLPIRPVEITLQSQGVRAVWTLRGRYVEKTARAVQHMQKPLAS